MEISVWLENLETLKTNAIKLDTDLSLAREELKKANADLEALYAASEQFSARIHENDIAQEEKRAQLPSSTRRSKSRNLPSRCCKRASRTTKRTSHACGGTQKPV